MTSILLGQELAAFIFYFLYESFFEWAFHKYLFHSPRFIKQTFKAHQLVHHQRYKYAQNSYEVQEGQERDHIAMDWFALPLFVAVHVPIFLVVQWATGWHSFWGGIGSVVAYYTVYEYFHYGMHVPSGKWFERTPVFQYVKEHHRIHHKYMQQNLNVFFPLADKVLGTYRSAASVAAKTQPAPTVNVTNTPAAPVAPTNSAPSPAQIVRAMTERSDTVGAE